MAATDACSSGRYWIVLIHMYIFLDFDGVLRRHGSDPTRLEWSCVEQFEKAVRPLRDLKIVIASTWRLITPLEEIRGYFSADVAECIVGVTPVLTGNDPHARYHEIQRYLDEQQVSEPWLVIDDEHDRFPRGVPALITDPYQGFDDTCTARLWELLMDAPDGTVK